MRKSFLPTILLLTLTAAIVLVLLCFTASAYIAADEELHTSEKFMQKTDRYYAAETTAVEIISKYSGSSSNNSSLTTGQSGKVSYSSPQGEILIYRADSSLSFAVPVDSHKELDVIVNVSEDNDLNILKWSLDSR